jgi:lysozyme family protein
MAADFRKILPHVDKWEGGLVFIPEEGQYTNRGIQWTTFKALAPNLIGIRNPTLDDLKNLTQKQWEAFIKYYWDVATFKNSVTNQRAAELMFQAFWGSGATGIKEMQKALKVTADGKTGPITVKAINTNPKAPEVLYNALESFYRRLATQRPERYGRFLKGWLNRLSELKPDKAAALGIILIGSVFLLYLITQK